MRLEKEIETERRGEKEKNSLLIGEKETDTYRRGELRDRDIYRQKQIGEERNR